MGLRSQRPLKVIPVNKVVGPKKNNPKNGGPRRRRGTRAQGVADQKSIYINKYFSATEEVGVYKLRDQIPSGYMYVGW
jgi:hypothetical protein